jgi:hypothetical protein
MLSRIIIGNLRGIKKFLPGDGQPSMKSLDSSVTLSANFAASAALNPQEIKIAWWGS